MASSEFEDIVRTEYVEQAKTICDLVDGILDPPSGSQQMGLELAAITSHLRTLKIASLTVGLSDASHYLGLFIRMLDWIQSQEISQQEEVTAAIHLAWSAFSAYVRNLLSGNIASFPLTEKAPIITEFLRRHGLQLEPPKSTEHTPTRPVRKAPDPQPLSLNSGYLSDPSRGIVRSRYGGHVESDGRTILLCEDDHDIRGIISTILRDIDCTVLETSNGAEALGFLATHPVDIFVTDLRMPKLDGIELIRRSRGHRAKLPIVVISGMAEKRDLLKLLKSGVTDFIEKPFEAGAIQYTIQRILREQQVNRQIRKVANTVLRRYGEMITLLSDLEPQDPDGKEKYASAVKIVGEIKGLTHLLMASQL